MSEGVLSDLLCVHIVGIENFDLHGLTLCVSEGLLSELLCIHNVGMGTFDLHGLISCASDLKVSSQSCFVSTVCAWKLSTFMD